LELAEVAGARDGGQVLDLVIEVECECEDVLR
jgi:hypothetical protein